MSARELTQAADLASFDRRNADWFIDKLMQALIFVGGISAIIFVAGIFVFITKEGLGFILDRFDFMEFFTSWGWITRCPLRQSRWNHWRFDCWKTWVSPTTPRSTAMPPACPWRAAGPCCFRTRRRCRSCG